jgi:hypothetical protein
VSKKKSRAEQVDLGDFLGSLGWQTMINHDYHG